MDQLADLIAYIKEGSNILNQHQGIIGIRKLLGIPDTPMIQTVIDAGLVQIMIKYIKQRKYPQLQL